MSKRLVGWLSVVLALVYCVTLIVPTTHAETLQSSNYKFDESTVGAGGLVQASSPNYKSNSSVGDLAVGSNASGGFQTGNGSTTTNDPTLSFIVNNAASFNSFSPGSATVTTATFSVSNYTSYGYVAQIVGNPPSNGTHTLPAMATTGVSQIGVEQFGINLVANTLPSSVGANPNNGQFGFGLASPNYATSGQYRYVSGETIASAPKSSGVTIYTISYLINVTSLTPGGQYTSNQTIIVTGTY